MSSLKANSAALNAALTLPGGVKMSRSDVMNALKMKPDTPLDAWLISFCYCSGQCTGKSSIPNNQADLDVLSKDRLKLGKAALADVGVGAITVNELKALVAGGVVKETALTAIQLKAIRM